MKKPVIAIAVLALVAAGIVLPAGYFGQVTETTLEDRMANMPYGFQMELTDYQRGWFSSTARLEWRPLGGLPMPASVAASPVPGASPMELPAPLAALASQSIAIDIEIAHGPVFFAVGPGAGLFHARGRIDLGGQTADGEEDPTGSYLELYVSSFSGATVYNRLELPDVAESFGPAAVDLAGVLVEGEWTGPDSFQLQRVALDKLGVSMGAAESGAHFAISGLEGSTEYPQGLASGAMLAPSQSTTSVGEILFERSEGNPDFRMTGLSSEDTTSAEEDGTYRTESDISIDTLEVLGREFAPIEIRQTAGGMSEESLDGLLTAFSEGFLEAPAMPPAPAPDENAPGPSATPPAGPPPAGTMPLTRAMQEAIVAMLADGPYTDMNAVLTYQGEHTLSLDLHYAFNKEFAPASVEQLSLMGFLAGLEYTVDAEVPIAAAEELFGQGIIQMGLMQGLLQRTETSYTLSVSLSNGMLNINGQPVPLPMLLPQAAPGAPPPPG